MMINVPTYTHIPDELPPEKNHSTWFVCCHATFPQKKGFGDKSGQYSSRNKQSFVPIPLYLSPQTPIITLSVFQNVLLQFIQDLIMGEVIIISSMSLYFPVVKQDTVSSDDVCVSAINPHSLQLYLIITILLFLFLERYSMRTILV